MDTVVYANEQTMPRLDCTDEDADTPGPLLLAYDIRTLSHGVHHMQFSEAHVLFMNKRKHILSSSRVSQFLYLAKETLPYNQGPVVQSVVSLTSSLSVFR